MVASPEYIIPRGKHHRPESWEEQEQKKLVGPETAERIAALPPDEVTRLAKAGLANYLAEENLIQRR